MTTLAYIPSPGFSKFQIGPFTIRMYAVCILIGVCFAVCILTGAGNVPAELSIRYLTSRW